MKKQRHWLDLAEYASLVGLGVGSVASFVSSQVLYTSAPLSLLVLLNLANRRRFEQTTRQDGAIAINDIDRKLAEHVELLNQQVSALPTPEALGNLKKSLLSKNQKVLDELSSELKTLQGEMIKRLTVLEKQDLGSVRPDVNHLQSQHYQLYDAIAHLTIQVQQLSNTSRLDQVDGAIAQLKVDAAKLRDNLQALNDQTRPSLNSLQDQINHLSRQFQKLPPPFDSSALRQEVSELIRVVADLVPKRDWHNLVTEVRTLYQQQESRAQNEEILRHKLQELNQQIQTRPLKANLNSLQTQINQLNQQFQKLPSPFDPSSLKQELAELMKAVAGLVPKRDWNALNAQIKALQQQQEFQRQFEQTLRRELQDLNQQLQLLSIPSEESSPESTFPDHSTNGEEPAALQPQQEFQARIEAILNQELQSIDRQLQTMPSGPQLQTQIEETLRRELQEINQQLQTFPGDPHYELVFDFKAARSPANIGLSASQTVLMQALDVTQARLVLIWPWSSQCNLDDVLMQRMEAFLNRGGNLDLGWCHLASREEERFLSPINQRWSINPMQQGLQATLQRLLQLKRAYPERFQFKILGTGENFLVSDQRFAVLGIDEALTATTVFPEIELKLRTDDAEIVQQCIERFDHPVLQPDDAIAHWNRGVTHYDLGDRPGALADFDQVLVINSRDAIAYNYRGLVQYDLGNLAAAIADFDHSLDINPDQVAAYCNRGFIRSEQGDQLGAIADYSLAIQNQPNSAIAYFYRGMACQKYNDPLAAVTDFSEAIQRVPDSAISYYYRAQAYQKLENLRGAIVDFERAARLFTERGNKTNAQKALRNLDKLKQTTAQPLVLHPTGVSVDPQTTDSETLISLFQHADVVEINGHGSAKAPEEPTAEPTAESTAEPTAESTAEPTAESTAEPTVESTAEPTVESTAEPMVEPTVESTVEPMVEPPAVPVTEFMPEPPANVDFRSNELFLTTDTSATIASSTDILFDLFEEPDIAVSTNGHLLSIVVEPILNPFAQEPLEPLNPDNPWVIHLPAATSETEYIDGVKTLSSFFYDADAAEDSDNGSSSTIQAADLSLARQPEPTNSSVNEHTEMETLAEFCSRFYA